MYKTNWFSVVVISATLSGIAQVPVSAQDCAPRSSRWFHFRSRSARMSPGCSAPEAVEPVCSAPASPADASAAPGDEPEAAAAPGPGHTAVAAAAAPVTFTAPPVSGEVTGATSGYGLRLPSLTIPEMRLHLPTLHMPSIVRTSRGPEMSVDPGRAPGATGTPAAYGPLMNAGFHGTQHQVASAAPAPAKPAAASKKSTATPAPGTAAPAPVEGCVPYSCPPVPPTDCNFSASATERELIETRKALSLVNERLQRLQREVGTVSRTQAQGEDGELPLPPSPSSTDRRSSYSNSTAASSVPKGSTASKVVGASYSESDFEDVEETTIQSAAPAKRTVSHSGPGAAGQWAPIASKKSHRSQVSKENEVVRDRSSAKNVDTQVDEFEDEVVETRSGNSASKSARRTTGTVNRQTR